MTNQPKSSASAVSAFPTIANKFEVLPPFCPHNSDESEYIPSIEFSRSIHRDIQNIAGNLEGFFTVYNNWVSGKLSCNFSVVQDMAIRAGLISSSFNTLAMACNKDRSMTSRQPLTTAEQMELVNLSNELGLSPSETIALIRSGLNK